MSSLLQAHISTPERAASNPYSFPSIPVSSSQFTLSDESLPQVVIRPDAGLLDLDLRQIWQYRELLLALATRDIKLRYRQTALGVSWVILQPILAAALLSVIFGKVAKLPSEGLPYFVFSYAGLLGWNAFSSTLNRASGCIVGNSGLISKIYFPRLILPLSIIFSALLDFSLALIVLAAMMLYFQITPTWGVLLLPLWLAILLFMALGIGLVASALMVTYRDVGHILPVAINLLQYASPAAFSLAAALERVGPRFYIFFYLNPLTGLLEAFRWSLLGVGELRLGLLAYSTVFAIVTFVSGMIFFKRKERWFADAI